MPKTAAAPESVQLVDWPAAHPEYLDNALEAKWDKILTLRGEITKGLENARRAKTIGHSLDARGWKFSPAKPSMTNCHRLPTNWLPS